MSQIKSEITDLAYQYSGLGQWERDWGEVMVSHMVPLNMKSIHFIYKNKAAATDKGGPWRV